MAALVRACEARDFPAKAVLVISNKPDASGIELAERLGVPVRTCDHTQFASKADFENALCDLLDAAQPDIICLAGFMRILGPTYFARIKVPTLNIHPSLLPKYKGLNTHRAALEAGDAEHGCSVHAVTDKLDDGDILSQRRIPILPDDTVETLTARLKPEEHIAYPEAVRKLCASL